MKAVAETIAAIGNPVLLQTVGNPTEPTATIARWRHNGCEVTITPADTVRVAISLQTGHHVRHESATATMSADVAVGSVTVMPADFSAVWRRSFDVQPVSQIGTVPRYYTQPPR
jgi:hypothetical protein